MKPGMPWSVKGIDQETREAAKDAARRSGMTLGEWLNTMILDQSDEEGSPASQPEAMHPPAAPVAHTTKAPAQPKQADAAARLEEIAEQLAQIARREQDTTPPRPVHTPPAARAEESEMLKRVLSRIETNERQTVEAFSAVNERLASLGRQLMAQASQVKEAPPAPAAEPAALKSLEQAVRNIVDHIEISDKRSRETMRALQERIADVAASKQQTAAASVVDLSHHDSAIASLQSKYQELVGRVERSERQPADAGSADLLRKELTQLADRIETVRSTAEQLASRAQTAAVQTSQRELHEIEGRILGVLKEAQSAFGGQGATTAEIQKLRGEIGSLNQRIDQMRSGTASERDVSALRTVVEQLQGRVAQGADMRPLADMDRRLNDLARRVEQQASRPPQVPPDLDRKLADIDLRMKDIMRLQADPRSNAALERKVTEMAERVAHTESKLSHIDTIERAVNQLFESIDHNRNWAKEAAEDAANRMAKRLMTDLPRASAIHASVTPGHSAELRALEDGLRAVRESAVHADQRNQETLEAVHETLEHIINKLAELETASVGHQLARATFAPAEAPSAEAPQQNWQQPEVSHAEPHLSAQLQAAAHEETYAAAAVRDGSEIPQWQPEIPATDNVPGQAAADDYIAAARRATRAAAQMGAAPSEVLPDVKSRMGFLKGLSIGRKRDVSEPVPAPGRGLEVTGGPDGGVRRTLLLAGMVLLMAVGAFWINARAPAPKVISSVDTTGSQGDSTSRATQPAVAPAAPQPMQSQIILPNETGESVVTGSIQKPDASVQSLVAEPGTLSSSAELPPAEIGTEALRLAAQDGNTSAQFIVATRYLDGNGVEANLSQAAHWYQKAAESGLAPAQYRLATLFERGRGVAKDASTAFVWYKRAAEQGNVKSMHNVAVLAAGNEIGAPNYELAHKWFLAASQHGLKDSQFNLALLYERGLGTTKDLDEALFWYMIAAGNQDVDAAKRVTALSAALPPSTVSKISQRVKSWVPEQGIESANVVSIKDPAWQDGRAQMRSRDGGMNEDLALQLLKSPLYNPSNASAAASVRPVAARARAATASDRPRDPLLSSALGLPTGDRQVSLAQNMLLRLGYDVGDASGIMDTRTSNAIRLFEFQTRQRVTGRVSEELLRHLQAYVG